MARIKTVSEESAKGPVAEIIANVRSQYGFLPGVLKVLLPSPELAGPAKAIYTHLNLRPGAALTRLQREMVATVVNGLIGGAP